MTFKNIESMELNLNNQKIDIDFSSKNFVSFSKDNGEEIFGMISRRLDSNEGILYEMIPFFGYNKETQENFLIEDSTLDIHKDKLNLKGLKQEDGLYFWKKAIINEKVDPQLEINKKLKAFIQPKINENIKNKKFSLKKEIDRVFNAAQQYLQLGLRETSFEDLYNQILESVKQSPSLLETSSNIAKSLVNKKLDDPNIPLKNKLSLLARELNSEIRKEEEDFIDAFSQKYKSGDLSNEDIVALISRYENNSNVGISDLLLEMKEVYTSNNILELEESSVSLNIGDKIGFYDENNISKIGFIIGFNDDKSQAIVKTRDKEFTIQCEKLEKLSKNQVFLTSEIKNLFNSTTHHMGIKWEDLSSESKVKILKGEFSNLYQGNILKENNQGVKEKVSIDFKLKINRSKEGLKLVVEEHKKDFKLSEFKLHDKELTQDQISKLQEGKKVIIETFDELGILQSKSQLSYDKEINTLSVSKDNLKFENGKKLHTKQTIVSTSKLKLN